MTKKQEPPKTPSKNRTHKTDLKTDLNKISKSGFWDLAVSKRDLGNKKPYDGGITEETMKKWAQEHPNDLPNCSGNAKPNNTNNDHKKDDDSKDDDSNDNNHRNESISILNIR